MITMLVVILVVLLAGFGLVVYALNQKLGQLKDDSALGMIKQDLSNIGNQLVQTVTTVNDRLDKSQELTRDSIMKQFSESSRLITDVTQRLAKLDETNKRVVDVADELKLLQNTLQNPKQRGVLGEYFLQTVLENVLPPGGFKLQYRLAKDDSGHDLVPDAVIILGKGKMLAVDSKFSLENYNRLMEEKDKGRQESLIKAIKVDLKNRIDETAKYIRPNEGTMDFAFMFVPSEAVYYDLLINKVGTLQTNARDLIEYAFQEKRVIIVSPTTLMAYLQTILQGLRSLQIEEQAKEIRVRVGQLGQHIAAYDQYVLKLGNSLGATVNHYNTAYRELKKIDKDVVRIAESTPSIEPLLIDRPQMENEL